MTREIKFRGKTLNGDWVEGAYFVMRHDDERKHTHHFIIPDGTPIPKDKPIGDIQVEVRDFTIGQFTGLHDAINQSLPPSQAKRNDSIVKRILTGEIPSAMLPTPQTQGLKVCDENGKTQFMDLDLLPTPTARDEKNGCGADSKRIERKKMQGWTIELNDLATIGILPTPRVNNAPDLNLNSPVLASRGKHNLEEAVAKMVVSAVAKDGTGTRRGSGYRLSPLYTEEMMGFPLMWTTLPFLSANGAPKPSKPMATPSSRK